MEPDSNHLLPTVGRGCGCKIPQSELETLLEGLDLRSNDANDQAAVLVDIRARGDVGVYRLNQDTLLAATVDFGTAASRDPYVWGRISALGALADLWAYNAKPLFALNVLGWPDSLGRSLAARVLAGGFDVLRESNTPVLGGHSVLSPEPFFGLALTGVVARTTETPPPPMAGDPLYLTKPLGMGVVLAAQQADVADASLVARMEQLALESVEPMARLVHSLPATICKDVSGFGLIGHLHDALRHLDVAVEIYAESVPAIAGVRDVLNQGVVPSSAEHQYAFSDWVDWTDTDLVARLLFCDPQTNGGLVFSVPVAYSDAAIRAAAASGLRLAQIGRITMPDQALIRVVPSSASSQL